MLNNLPHIADGHARARSARSPRGRLGQVETVDDLRGPAVHDVRQCHDLNVKILTAVLIILMSLSTFTTQRQLMRKNMPASALDNPFIKQQKVLLYLMPLFFAISGINFPIGVLLYWLTTNVWSMGQQFYVIRRMPAPGSAAERACHERLQAQGQGHQGAHGRRASADAEDRPGRRVRSQRPAPAAQGQEARGTQRSPADEEPPLRSSTYLSTLPWASDLRKRVRPQIAPVNEGVFMSDPQATDDRDAAPIPQRSSPSSSASPPRPTP